jgi:hypothetical protein
MQCFVKRALCQISPLQHFGGTVQRLATLSMPRINRWDWQESPLPFHSIPVFTLDFSLQRLPDRIQSHHATQQRDHVVAGLHMLSPSFPSAKSPALAGVPAEVAWLQPLLTLRFSRTQFSIYFVCAAPVLIKKIGVLYESGKLRWIQIGSAAPQHCAGVAI